MKNLTSLVLIAVLMLFINSCEKDEFQTTSDSVLKSGLENNKNIIDNAQAWFNSHPEENKYTLLEKKDKLEWNKAIINDLDSILIVEIPIKLKENYILKVDNEEHFNVEQRILIYLTQDSTYSLIEFFISDEELDYLQNTEKINYKVKEKDFEGYTILMNNNEEIIEVKSFKPETPLKSASSGYCVYLCWIYNDGSIQNIALIYCVMPAEDSGSGGSGGGGTTIVDPTDDIVDDLPEVYTKDLEQNEKALCIYDKLIDGAILNDFIKRYYPPTKPFLPALGELNLTWTLGSSTKTVPIGDPDNGVYNSVVIQLDEASLNGQSATNNALNMLHEALHAKLIAEMYDEVGSTDFKILYAQYKGWGQGDLDAQQELEMYNFYITDIASALKSYDESQGINNNLDEYKAAVRYDLADEIFDVNHSEDDYNSYLKILIKSSKTCN
ncbi:hypothetical protein [uncultured Draconibacterium sp.]|uniref:hypothetical protein n=1 Tax=uncultured Draconibacterium sp. TaxID=1573823 RepID=UPI002AA6123D|nr:hypothetical protein [uncultured Draconibacterium sp.]